MGMVVRTNTMALNAYRQLGMNNSAVAKSLEKLSSGFRINRAGDDAAGLAISEKMKAQITGLETASANAQDGISLIQTAEGNLTEVHSMLNRMVELASKSANGTYTSQERSALQAEVDSLLSEIDRISQSANFNGTRLLDGSMGLNNEGFKVTGSTAATKNGEITITTGVDVSRDDHISGDKQEVKPKFTVDFSEFSATLAKGDGTDAPTGAKIGLKIGGTDIKVWDATQNAGAGGWVAWSSSITGDKDNDVTTTGAQISALFTANTKIKIGEDVFENTTAGAGGKVTFEWIGTAASDAAAEDTNAAVSETTWVPSGAFTVTLDKGTATSFTVDSGLRSDCDVTKVDDPVVGSEKKRAGAGLTLTKDMVSDGAKLKIGNTVFTFSASADANGTQANPGDNVTISIKGVADDDLVKYATEQLSNFTAVATHKDVAGNETTKTFAINRESEEKIHIDEAETNPNYAGFTKTELEGMFKQLTSAANAKTTLVMDNSKINVGDKIVIDGTAYEVKKVGSTAEETLASMGISNATMGTDGKTVTITASSATASAPVISGSGLVLQIGDTADPFNKMEVKVGDMSSNGLGIAGLSIKNETSASNAIDTIKNAINTVSTARAGMGALQNRLEHTINNLDVAVENLSAANSRIRDTDMAKEMMNYTKMNVLVQSAQAMLAQANQQPQSVLQLLQ